MGGRVVPRIRSIKPEFFTSEAVAELNFRQRLLWEGLWCHQDDDGRCRDNARVIKGAVFPLDDEVTAELVEDDLVTLEKRGRIIRYSAEGRSYIATVNFSEHQKPNRPTPSKLPPPPHEPSGPGPGGLTDDSVSEFRSDNGSDPYGQVKPRSENAVSNQGGLTEDAVQEGEVGVGGEKEGRWSARGRAGRLRPAEPPDDDRFPVQLCARQHDPEPDCTSCGQARRAGVTPESVAANIKRDHAKSERSARESCPWANHHDPNGWLEHPVTRDPLVRCDHQMEPRIAIARALGETA